MTGLPNRGDTQTHSSDRTILGLIVVAVLIAFARSLLGSWAWDDTAQILDNRGLSESGAVLRAFTQHVWAFAPEQAEARYYRPVFTLWLVAGKALFGNQPLGWHLASILLHALAAGLVFRVLRRLNVTLGVAALGTLLFALHPTRAESVSWISGVTDPLAAALGWGAVLVALGGQCRRRLISSALLFLAALGTKEPALVFLLAPLLLAWGQLTDHNEPPADADSSPDPTGLIAHLRSLPRALRAAGPTLVAWGAALGVYAAARAATIGISPAPTQELSLSQVGGSIIELLGGYTGLTFLPWDLSIAYPLSAAEGWAEPDVLHALPLAAAGVFAWWLLVRGGGTTAALGLLGSLFLAPALNVPGLQADGLLHDRYLYLPMSASAPAAALLLDRWTRSWTPRTRAGLALISIAAVSVLLQPAQASWQNDEALWTQATKVHPQSGKSWFNLGVMHEHEGELAEAEEAYRQALAAQPDRAIVHFQLAHLLAEQRELQAARGHFLRAVELRPADPMMLYEAARIEGHLGDPRRALGLFDRAMVEIEAGRPIGGGIQPGDLHRERTRVADLLAAEPPGPPDDSEIPPRETQGNDE